MFCPKCGKEILDDAYVCVGCGSIVSNSPVNAKNKANNVKGEKDTNKLVSKILVFASYLFITAVIILFAYNLMNPYTYVSYHNYVYFYYSYDMLLATMIVSIVNYVVSAAGFVFGLLCKDENVKTTATICFILAHAFLVASIICYA